MKTNPIHFIRWFFILGMILFSIFPSFYIILVSLKSINSFQVSLDQDLFSNLSSHNFTRLFSETDFLVWLKNSVLVSLAVTVCGVALASTCAYALSRYSFSGKKFLLFSLLATQMFPATMMMLPFFIILTKLSLIDSFLGLSLIYSSTALPFCIWQLKAYYDTIPRELEEAARVDGCPDGVIFFRVILPISLPGLAITAVFCFMTAWSEYMIAAILLQDTDLYTLPLGLKSFQASLATQWGLYAAAALVVSLPVVVVFIFLSRYLISGLTMGSVKG